MKVSTMFLANESTFSALFRFQQMSFVNSIATTKGGRHVDHVADAVIKSIIDKIKKNNKTGINIKNFQVNC